MSPEGGEASHPPLKAMALCLCQLLVLSSLSLYLLLLQIGHVGTDCLSLKGGISSGIQTAC